LAQAILAQASSGTPPCFALAARVPSPTRAGRSRLPLPGAMMQANRPSQELMPNGCLPKQLSQGRPMDRHTSRRSKLFPFDFCKMCPPPASALTSAFCPKSWRKIQDWTHLVLLLGVVVCGIMATETIHSVLWARNCWRHFCISEFLSIVFMTPCAFYFVHIIGQYDEHLQEKQMEARGRKEQLTQAYHATLSDMDGLLSKAAESSAGLAERSFESKRRDFQRFLERARSRYIHLYGGTKGDSDEFLKQFRRFVSSWLKVFEECSIDPIHCPKRVVTPEELDRCGTIGEVADLTLERLRVTEVRFISIQRDQDARMLRKNKHEIRRLTADRADLRLAPPGDMVGPAAASGLHSLGVGGRRRLTWLAFGVGQGFRFTSALDGFPKELRLGLVRVILLSRDHFALISGWFVGWLIILLQWLQYSKSGSSVVWECLASEVCIGFLLYRFEEIDIVQQLERELQELRVVEQNVKEQRQKMREFWNNAQQLTDLWLYRTVPRLDLHHEVRSHLEDTNAEELIGCLLIANTQLEAIDNGLGELCQWRNDGALSTEAKKGFGRTLNQICQEQELDHVLRKLCQVNEQGLLMLGPGQTMRLTNVGPSTPLPATGGTKAAAAVATTLSS